MSIKKETLFQKLTSTKVADELELSGKPKDSWIVRIIIFISTIGLCAFFFSFHLYEHSSETRLYNVVPGYIWPSQTITAKFTFSVYKDETKYQNELREARKNAIQVFFFNANALDLALAELDTLKKDYIFNPEELSANDSRIAELLEAQGKLEEREFRRVETQIKNFLENIYSAGFINVSTEQITTSEILVRIIAQHVEKLYTSEVLIDSSIYLERARDFFPKVLNAKQAEIALRIAHALMEPNLILSQELTNRSRKIAEESVARTEGIVREGEILVTKGQQVTGEILKKLKSYERSRLMSSDVNYTIWSVLGSIGHASVLYAILILYLFFIRKKIFYDNFQLSILSFMLVLIAFTSWLSVQIPTKMPIEYFVMLPALSILAAIVFDSRTAFYVTVAMALMLAGVRGNDYDTGTAMLFAGTLAAYTVRDIRSRTQVFQSMFFLLIGFAVPILAFGLERSADIFQTVYKLMFALFNSALSPLLTFGMLFLLERVSNITTDLRLQEYNNINHPLLTKLNELAPGTYQHTMAVAMLAEKCATAIGANSLLAKVGAYFHDIGKIVKPEYFVENQLDMGNKHDLLPAKKSALAIKNHVLEGIKIAKEYKLPQRIIDFIPMHHGTTLIKHFYAKALEDAEDKSHVIEDDFRYPGPKPQSKEAAILMICDPAEALSRLPSKDKQKFERTISDLIQDRMKDGQFDECKLTLQELKIIKETCVKNLMAINHPRVEYKQIPQDDNIV